MTFEEMAAVRDPLYQATRPVESFRTLKAFDMLAAIADDTSWRNRWQARRDDLARLIQQHAMEVEQ